MISRLACLLFLAGLPSMVWPIDSDAIGNPAKWNVKKRASSQQKDPSSIALPPTPAPTPRQNPETILVGVVNKRNLTRAELQSTRESLSDDPIS